MFRILIHGLTLGTSIVLGLLIGAYGLSRFGPGDIALELGPAPFAVPAPPGDNAALIAGVTVVLTLLLVFNYLFLRSVLGWGIVLGLLLWVPFGNHILARQPFVATLYPLLPGHLDDVVATNPALGRLRATAETWLPVPPTARADQPAATRVQPPVAPAAERATRSETPRFEPVQSRLPQITE